MMPDSLGPSEVTMIDAQALLAVALEALELARSELDDGTHARSVSERERQRAVYSKVRQAIGQLQSATVQQPSEEGKS